MIDRLGIAAMDDNKLALAALERWVSAAGAFRWLGGVSTPEELVRLISREPPALVLLDIDMPGVDTFALLTQLIEHSPSLKVVMFSGFVRADYVERALSAGASGYVIKDEPMSATVDLLRRAAEGECVLSDAAAAAFMQGA
ncbi:MAG: hypothetical protein RL417_1161 [Pseudomonadota bacterium]|jgi:two-component system response regulator DesR